MSICGGMDWRELWAILKDVSWVYGGVFVFFIFFMFFWTDMDLPLRASNDFVYHSNGPEPLGWGAFSS